MAKNMFGEIFTKTAEVTNKLKDSVTTIGSITDSNKKLKECLEKRAKLYEFLGIEVHSLYKGGRFKIEELDTFYKQIDQADEQILEIKKLIEEATTCKEENVIVCECGAKLNKLDKFCPNCGKRNETGEIICKCGNTVIKGTKFCPECGMRVEELMKAPEMKSVTLRCVCGAEVKEDDVICMECGRKVNMIK